MLRYVLAVQSTGKVHIAILFNALFLSDNPTGTYFFLRVTGLVPEALKKYCSDSEKLQTIFLTPPCPGHQ